jgi:hypothetical protein
VPPLRTSASTARAVHRHHQERQAGCTRLRRRKRWRRPGTPARSRVRSGAARSRRLRQAHGPPAPAAYDDARESQQRRREISSATASSRRQPGHTSLHLEAEVSHSRGVLIICILPRPCKRNLPMGSFRMLRLLLGVPGDRAARPARALSFPLLRRFPPLPPTAALPAPCRRALDVGALYTCRRGPGPSRRGRSQDSFSSTAAGASAHPRFGLLKSVPPPQKKLSRRGLTLRTPGAKMHTWSSHSTLPGALRPSR